MKITIEINTDNSAFCEYEDEIKRVLDRAYNYIQKGYEDIRLLDTNGNKVGTLKITN